MTESQPATPQMTTRLRSRGHALLIVVCVTGIMTLYYKRFLEAGQGTDFPHFYCAAKIVAAGLGHQLYDISLQWDFQRRYTGRVGNFFIHPPFEALIYLPFAGLPIQAAYLAWTLFNLVVLAVAAWLFHSRLSLPISPGLGLVLMLSFVPVSLNFLQGQDTILLLLVFVLTCVALGEGKNFEAGCLLALGLFKFQFALPATVIFFVSRKDGSKKKFAAGFALVAVVLALISLGISGWSSLTSYPRLLLGFGKVPFSGFHAEAMATVRGGCLALFPAGSVLSRVAFVGASLLVLAVATDGWRRLNSTVAGLAVSNAVLAAVLLSYQASPHDLTLVVLPVFLTFTYLWRTPGLPAVWRRLSLFVLAVLFLPPLHVYAVRVHLYVLLAVPLIALLFLNYVEIRRLRIPEARP
jgi:alpha-1,2-mannosyltransferase